MKIAGIEGSNKTRERSDGVMEIESEGPNIMKDKEQEKGGGGEREREKRERQ